MPTIRPSAYLRNNYNAVSDFCHTKMEPMFITKNGHGDLAVLSIEAYEKFCGRYELYHMLDEALAGEECGAYSDFDDFMAEFRKEML
ncbi:MAG: type II toxin-antitoxin system Phd/YefM family antitoxin [Lachnospiraceae bacterium]|jgi:PHD/YefM family antitoxin component YafN of YafNO toxin-antitoxin module|nr:type II toxin-antitoxin system Phd/YefM family antitoxin [Lachnospiraceae bacterium]